tara:strand:- start:398 stop:901 length:504 start_codon:yes stop_codon:yes gene_type:complete
MDIIYMDMSKLSKSIYNESSTLIYNNTPDIVKDNISNVISKFNEQTIIMGKKKRTFKEKFSYEQRYSESKRIISKYPEKIPIICERMNGEVKDLDRHKYLCPGDLTMGDFVYIIRKRLDLPSHKSIFFLVNETIMFPNTEQLKIIYNSEKDKDGFLYIKYSSESTFG